MNWQFTVGARDCESLVFQEPITQLKAVKPEKYSERLRGAGNSSGNEIGSGSMNYWEIIAEQIGASLLENLA